MGFTKLDAGIIHSSIWSEDYAVRIVWVTMLAMADSKGFVASSNSGLCRAANVSVDECQHAIKKLCEPDNDSRSPEYDGRRIEASDGGWTILNYKKYRERFHYSEKPDAVRQRKHREKIKNIDVTERDMSRTCRDVYASASASLIFSYWQEKENLIHHKILSPSASNILEKRLTEHTEEELKNTIDAYNAVLSDNTKYWYTYKHTVEAFFRNGERKESPFKKFLSEAEPLTNFLREKPKAQTNGKDRNWV